MTAPNANTSGLAQDLCERLDAILIEESPMHPFGCATWEEASRVAIDMAKEVIVTAASAQARIAELKRDRTELARIADEWATEAHDRGNKLIATEDRAIDASERAEAAEARADRLASALTDLVSWFDKPVQGERGMVWVIRAGDQGADDAVTEALAALKAEGK